MSKQDSGFRGGLNIAIKVPPHQFEATVQFYRDVLQLPLFEWSTPDVVFAFGPNRLWIDRAPALSQAEVWLELVTDDLSAAAERVAAAGVTRRDEIESLPEGLPGFWIASPSSIIHLITQVTATPEPRRRAGHN